MVTSKLQNSSDLKPASLIQIFGSIRLYNSSINNANNTVVTYPYYSYIDRESGRYPPEPERDENMSIVIEKSQISNITSGTKHGGVVYLESEIPGNRTLVIVELTDVTFSNILNVTRGALYYSGYFFDVQLKEVTTKVSFYLFKFQTNVAAPSISGDLKYQTDPQTIELIGAGNVTLVDPVVMKVRLRDGFGAIVVC